MLRLTDDCTTLKMTRGNIDMSRPLVASSRKRHFYRSLSAPKAADQPVTAALQNHGRILQCKLNVLAHSIIQIDLRHVDRGLIRAMFKYDRKIVFPFAVAGRAWIVGNHRRTTLSECPSCNAQRDRRDR